MRVPSWIALAACLAPLTVSCAALASLDPDMVTMAANGLRGSGNKTPMTYSELSQCGTTMKQIHDADCTLQGDSRTIESRRLALRRFSDSLDVARPFVDTKNSAAVTSYNLRLDKYRADERTFNADVERHNALVDSRNLQNNLFAASCAGRPYRRSDFASLPFDLRSALEQP